MKYINFDDDTFGDDDADDDYNDDGDRFNDNIFTVAKS